MSSIHTQTVGPAHSYTSEDIPWESCGKNLMRAYGRTVSQTKSDHRLGWTYVGLSVLAALWLTFYLF